MADNPKKPRPATPAELALWARWKRLYHTRLTPVVNRSRVTAEIAADAQLTVDRLGIEGFIFDERSMRNMQWLLDQFNKLGRIITAVESGRYFVRMKDGDLDILALESMPREQYDQDIFDDGSNLGALPVIVWALAVGVVIVAGLFAASTIIESSAKKQEAENKRALLDADKEMAKASPQARRAWSEFKSRNRPKAQQVGVLEKLFGSGTVSTLATALGIGVIAYFAFSGWGRKAR